MKDVSKLLKDLEKKSDYSLALMEEIATDIRHLSEYSSSNIGNNLDDINNKIDFARQQGINVDSLDKEVLSFRILLFTKRVDKKLVELKSTFNKYSTNILTIQKEYNELYSENNIDAEALNKQMNKIYNEIIRAKIKFMIIDIEKSGGISVYSMDQIIDELHLAKEKGILVDDIEEMLLG